MQKAVERAKSTGALDSSHALPIASPELTQANVVDGYATSMIDFLAPIGVLLGFCIVPWVLGDSPMVFEGFGLAVVAALLVSTIKGMRVVDAFDAVISGIKGVTVGAIVLGLAVTLATASKELGTSQFVIAAAAPALESMPFVLPALLLFICMGVAFSIGSSWGTYAVVFPVALPLAYALSADPTYISLTFGAILGGAVFGDQCSPISDTTILSSLACGSDLMDHVTTQLPLALFAAVLAALGYLIIGYSLF
jgi:Na+/H+ antiporter NhaC